MGKVEVKDEEAGEAMLKGTRRSSQRKASSSSAAAAAASGNWRKMFFCCIQAVEDEVQELDYQHAGLTDVPAEVFTHERTLEVLRLDCNQISDLPRPLFHCHGLKELWLTDNEIVQLPPALASLIHLEVLDVSKNALTEVPDTISGLKALITLDLSINPLGKLPEGATKLLSLETLNLSDTFLDFLPANFGRLTKLRLLELRENQLATLPKSMARLTALKRLDLGQNDLCDLPDVIGSIPSLEELWIDGNKLDVLPDFLGQLPNLVHLDACRNALQGIAPSIGLCRSLSDLSLTANNLDCLPEEIGDLSQLVVLRVDDNRLSSLPDSIGRLSRLEELQAGQNRLTKLPASIGLLRQLQTLMLNENELQDLPAELGSCQKLTVFSARKNKLDRLPPEIGQLSRLRVVNVSCNRLLHLPVSMLKLQPALAALWLSEAQTKPVVPLQTDTDAATGHKVLTCFLLPQTESTEPEQQPTAHDDSPVVAARSPTHIKFAFDGEVDPDLGTERLSRNPTPYPKELKALAKHAQHIQQHQPNSPRNSLNEAPVAEKKTSTSEAPTTVQPSVAIVSKLLPVSSSSNESTVVVASPVPPPRSTVAVPPVTVSLEVDSSQVKPPISPRTLPPAQTPPPVPRRNASLENLVESDQPPMPPPKLMIAPEQPMTTAAPSLPSPKSAEIEIKEARVLRPLKSTELTEDSTSSSSSPPPPPLLPKKQSGTSGSQLDLQVAAGDKQQPPPYHVAAAYSKRAAEFQHPGLPRTQSTDSGFTVVDGKTSAPAVENGEQNRDNSPSRDSGRGPSIEPLEEVTVTGPVAAQPVSHQPVARRPTDLALMSTDDRTTPLMIKRSTFIIEKGVSPPGNENVADENEELNLQSVAALRQAAREVFLSASPRNSPLPSHKPSMWGEVSSSTTTTNGNSVATSSLAVMSAANVLGLPSTSTSSSSQENSAAQMATKIQGRLPPPRYHVSSSTLSNGFSTGEQLKSPTPSITTPTMSSTRIPMAASNNRLIRQTSNLSQDGGDMNNVPALPPKQPVKLESSAPPTLQPKLSMSRIPPPQVLSPRTSFSPLPVHTARLMSPVQNNNDSNIAATVVPTTPVGVTMAATPEQSSKPGLGGINTRIPLPKYSTGDIAGSKSGPSPAAVSRIPTRLPTPTASTPTGLNKGRLLSPTESASPSLAPPAHAFKS